MKLVQGACLDARKIEVAKGLWLVPTDAEDDAVADPKVVCKERTDLPKGHPLYGRRVLAVVPAGSSDIEATDEGLKPTTSAAVVAPEEK